jgi:hypothetical protein
MVLTPSIGGILLDILGHVKTRLAAGFIFSLFLLCYRFNANDSGATKIAVEFTDHFTLELHQAIDERIQSGIAGDFYVLTSGILGAMLTNDNFAFLHFLIAVNFNA